MNPPTSQKEVRQFIGVVNYYCDMWTRSSHTFAPLTNIMTRKVKLKFD